MVQRPWTTTSFRTGIPPKLRSTLHPIRPHNNTSSAHKCIHNIGMLPQDEVRKLTRHCTTRTIIRICDRRSSKELSNVAVCTIPTLRQTIHETYWGKNGIPVQCIVHSGRQTTCRGKSTSCQCTRNFMCIHTRQNTSIRTRLLDHHTCTQFANT